MDISRFTLVVRRIPLWNPRGTNQLSFLQGQNNLWVRSSQSSKGTCTYQGHLEAFCECLLASIPLRERAFQLLPHLTSLHLHPRVMPAESIHTTFAGEVIATKSYKISGHTSLPNYWLARRSEALPWPSTDNIMSKNNYFLTFIGGYVFTIYQKRFEVKWCPCLWTRPHPRAGQGAQIVQELEATS